MFSFLNDPKKLEGIVGQAFGMFDKDKSGFIEQKEIIPVVEKVCQLAGMKTLPADKIQMVFGKFAGADGKVDKQEFTKLVTALFKMAGVGGGSGGSHA